jgi:hypothetical protein
MRCKGKESTMQEAMVYLPGFGKAAQCDATQRHVPTPVRFVWHHIQPQEAGGATVQANLIQVCDNCHYSIHRLMFNIANGLDLGLVPRQSILSVARIGYTRCQAAGTVDKIPNEG